MARNVNFRDIAEEFIKEINRQFIEKDSPLILGISITTKGKVKTIRFYSADAGTGERTLLYSSDYVVKNSAEFLQQDIEYLLYRELFFNAIAFYGINMDAHRKEEQALEAVKNITPKVSEFPITPKDAFKKV